MKCRAVPCGSVRCRAVRCGAVPIFMSIVNDASRRLVGTGRPATAVSRRPRDDDGTQERFSSSDRPCGQTRGVMELFHVEPGRTRCADLNAPSSRAAVRRDEGSGASEQCLIEHEAETVLRSGRRTGQTNSVRGTRDAGQLSLVSRGTETHCGKTRSHGQRRTSGAVGWFSWVGAQRPLQASIGWARIPRCHDEMHRSPPALQARRWSKGVATPWRDALPRVVVAGRATSEGDPLCGPSVPRQGNRGVQIWPQAARTCRRPWSGTAAPRRRVQL